ncbi:NAD(P)/FAD-dependent oxidoreductase [Marinobacterium lutimaris]|uniref:NADH dehydrogenase n=1 Tax=Marinobacterium lutimaris TaxID=568106 RepID=A0A1H5W1V1_9GAMM|nr:NAD(P)/FAD-dependent oxidoreductase [Marinobacterium lutimaris]SEF93472.1 NADH dehydrogenase [Marinobacterium lutimaris]
MKEKSYYQHVIVVGGGAGGLELATRLGRRYGRKGLKVTLVDRETTHVWKPLLHEVATGRLDSSIDELSYRAQGRQAGFHFQIGELEGLDRSQRCIRLAPVLNSDGEELVPARTLFYDYLVIAIGSRTNDFGISGVRENCCFLDDRNQADNFHNTLLEACLRLSTHGTDNQLRISIVGAGATGVELSAELYNAAQELVSYGLSSIQPSSLKVTLIEAAPRILGALPPRISSAAKTELRKLGVDVRENTQVVEVNDKELVTSTGESIPAHLVVWAAGIKGPELLTQLDGLETNRRNQLVVGSDLRTSRDERVFALGDCAACERRDEEGGLVPPRAQAAHQMASHLYKHFDRILKGEDIPAYTYKDYGSLVSLSKYTTVGNLMGNLTKGSIMVEGTLARLVYVSLYRLHQVALYGYFKTMLVTIVARINKVIRPRMKLH